MAFRQRLILSLGKEKKMNEKIFWVWNGWGLFFTGIIAIFQFLFVFITLKMGPTPARKPTTLVILGLRVLVWVNLYLLEHTGKDFQPKIIFIS